jgi:hypothetical protein
MKRFFYTLIFLLIVFCSPSKAQGLKLTDAGTTELAGTISYANYKAPAVDVSYSVFTFAPQVSYFFIENLSLGITTGLGYLPGISIVSPSDGESSTVVQLFLSPAYHFPIDSKQLYPFVEGQIGYALVTDGDASSGLSYGGRAGIKFTPVEHFVITFAGQFTSLRLYEDGSDERIGWDYWTIGFGVGGYF